MDVLSEVLKAVQLTGAVFFDISAQAPWGIGSPPTAEIRARIMPASGHLVAFHCVMEGKGFIQMRDNGGRALPIEAGDVVLLPRGDAHFLSSDGDLRVTPNLGHFYRPTEQSLPFRVFEGSGQGAGVRILCGYFGFDAAPFNPLLEALPTPTIIKTGPDLVGMRDVFRALSEGSQHRPGGELLLSKLSELMLIEALRLYIDTLPPSSQGWLSGLRDPMVGRALQRLHGAPANDWTLECLARDVGLSRSVLAERFSRLVGQPPMTYLARWRMQLATRALMQPRTTIAGVAAEVGYESEAAFNRAFKKIVGTPPGSWRRRRLEAA